VGVPSVETLEQVSAFGANLATVAAVGVGSWWAYSRFIKERTGEPNAAISWRGEHRRLTEQDYLLRITVELENTGQILLSIKCMRCEVAQVAPPAPEALKLLAERKLISEEHLADLGCIRCYEKDFDVGEVRIEPGEKDIFPFDFVISTDISTVSIYSHVMNSKEKEKEIGWELSAFYDLSSTKDQPQAK
jgi:hypothetical protein